MAELITVITPSCQRRKLLLRAVQSVANQTHQPVEHIIVGDNHPSLDGLKPQIKEINPAARVVNLDTAPEVAYPPLRTSIARNQGITMARGNYIAHLDDDNEFEPNHLSSLVEALKLNRAGAIHSWRKMLNPDGTPFIVNNYPWPISQTIERHVFEKLVDAGMFVPGTNEVRDQIITPDGEAILHVDSSEWLIRANVHRHYPFPLSYSLKQMIQYQTEDDMLATELYQAGITIACSNRSTLLYYLGGYSNVVD